MSNWFTVTIASAYTGSENPVSCTILRHRGGGHGAAGGGRGCSRCRAPSLTIRRRQMLKRSQNNGGSILSLNRLRWRSLIGGEGGQTRRLGYESFLRSRGFKRPRRQEGGPVYILFQNLAVP